MAAVRKGEPAAPAATEESASPQDAAPPPPAAPTAPSPLADDAPRGPVDGASDGSLGGPPPPAPPPPAAPTAPYTIAKGMSVTTLRGIIAAGEEVSERDFPCGKEDLDDLVARGAIVKA